MKRFASSASGCAYFFIVRSNKYIIDISIIQEALVDKSRLEALAFSLLLKNTFVSSLIKCSNLSGRHFKSTMQIMHLGTLRGSRCIQNGIRYGYLEKTRGGHIVAKKLHTKDAYKSRVEIKEDTRINNVQDILRRIVLVNHVKKQCELNDTINRVKSGTRGQREKALRRLKAYAISSLHNFSNTLSLSSIRRIINCSQSKAVEVSRSLVQDSVLFKKENWRDMPLRMSNGYRLFNDFSPVGMFARYKDGRVQIQCANTYTYNSKKGVVFK